MAEGKKLISNGNFTPEFDTLVSEAIENWKIPGISVAVTDGVSTCAKAYGLARFPEEKVTPETLFHCASMSKAFTAAAVSFLVDDNEKYPNIQWTTPVSEILREDFVLSDSMYTEHVTVEDILSHRSGLPDHDDACLGIYSSTPDTPKSVTRRLRYLPINAPLRTKYQYSNIMYTVACHLVEHVTSETLGTFLRRKIWEPLGMNNTYFGMDDLAERRGLDDIAKGYYWDNENGKHFEVPWPKQPEGAGAGEMISSVHDFIKFLEAMMKKAGPISEKSHEELVKPRTIIDEKPIPFGSTLLYALGWEITTFHGELIIGHTGCINGFASKMLYLPRLQWGFVTFGNFSGSDTAQEKICGALIDELLSIPIEKRPDEDPRLQRWEEDDNLKTVEEWYPHLPTPRIPLTLPMTSYAGKYKDKGYETLVVECKDGKLVVDGTDRTYRIMFSFEHVSGEFFVVTVLDIDTHYRERKKAEFRLGPDGRVKEMGMNMSGDMEELIWFQRCEE